MKKNLIAVSMLSSLFAVGCAENGSTPVVNPALNNTSMYPTTQVWPQNNFPQNQPFQTNNMVTPVNPAFQYYQNQNMLSLNMRMRWDGFYLMKSRNRTCVPRRCYTTSYRRYEAVNPIPYYYSSDTYTSTTASTEDQKPTSNIYIFHTDSENKADADAQATASTTTTTTTTTTTNTTTAAAVSASSAEATTTSSTEGATTVVEATSTTGATETTPAAVTPATAATSGESPAVSGPVAGPTLVEPDNGTTPTPIATAPEAPATTEPSTPATVEVPAIGVEPGEKTIKVHAFSWIGGDAKAMYERLAKKEDVLQKRTLKGNIKGRAGENIKCILDGPEKKATSYVCDVELRVDGIFQSFTPGASGTPKVADGKEFKGELMTINASEKDVAYLIYSSDKAEELYNDLAVEAVEGKVKEAGDITAKIKTLGQTKCYQTTTGSKAVTECVFRIETATGKALNF